MEYEFRHDTITGNASAIFSYEHQIIGPWLEVEIGQSNDKLAQLLSTIDNVTSGKMQECVIIGHEYSVEISVNDVIVSANGMMNGANEVPEQFLSDELNMVESTASCGTEDFLAFLKSWADFIKT